MTDLRDPKRGREHNGFWGYPTSTRFCAMTIHTPATARSAVRHDEAISLILIPNFHTFTYDSVGLQIEPIRKVSEPNKTHRGEKSY